MREPVFPYPMPGPVTGDADGNIVPVRNVVPRGRPTFRQNIGGHIFNALTRAVGDDDPWWPLSRRLEIAEAATDAVLAFLAPFGLNPASSSLPDDLYWIES